MSVYNALLNPGMIGQAAIQGFEMASARTEERERRNALRDYYTSAFGSAAPGVGNAAPGIVATPEQQAEQAALETRFPNAPSTNEGASGPSNDVMTPELRRLLEVSPDVAVPLLQQRQEQQSAAHRADIQRRAALGEPEAMAEFAGFDLVGWRGLRADQRAEVAREATVIANAALDVLALPPEERAQAIMGYANQYQSAEIAAMANLPPERQETALRAAVAEANMMVQLHRQEAPDWTVYDPTQTVVNMNDSAAVAALQNQRAGEGIGTPAPAAPPSTASTPPTYTGVVDFSQWEEAVRRNGSPEAAASVYIANGMVVNATAEQIPLLPPGISYRAPDGSIRRRGGQ